MGSFFGEKVRISVFGESHGTAMGVIIDGLPSGEEIDMNEVYVQMSRRAPGGDKTATPRKEADFPEVLSGMLNGKTTGAPLAAVIHNTNTRSSDYGNLLDSPRPGHADYTAYLKYSGFNDIRGGGHFSGRLTANIVFAGAVVRQILKRRGISIAAHIYSIGNVSDTAFDACGIDSELTDRLNKSKFALVNTECEQAMRDVVEAARLDSDSVGGIIECIIQGMPAGVGDPMFNGVENVLSAAMFGVPAVKGIEFGSGFSGTLKRGSQNNDEFYFDEKGIVRTYTNNHGGALGGITSGMPIVFRVAVKPTPSVSAEQKTVNLQTGENTTVIVKGRHDPCIVPRAVPVIEAAAAIAVINML
ncbi:MAG: chorismate synthase [Acutalibacteraceae bacterium]|nr:chorismate synthase [Clostridia bacterium]MEE3449701.1 chorismate synthase [Acutalibacteraceae bacterium]